MMKTNETFSLKKYLAPTFTIKVLQENILSLSASDNADDIGLDFGSIWSNGGSIR